MEEMHRARYGGKIGSFQAVFQVRIIKRPHTNPDMLRGGLCGGLTNSETYSNHIGWSGVKILSKSSLWLVVLS